MVADLWKRRAPHGPDNVAVVRDRLHECPHTCPRTLSLPLSDWARSGSDCGQRKLGAPSWACCADWSQIGDEACAASRLIAMPSCAPALAVILPDTYQTLPLRSLKYAYTSVVHEVQDVCDAARHLRDKDTECSSVIHWSPLPRPGFLAPSAHGRGSQ